MKILKPFFLSILLANFNLIANDDTLRILSKEDVHEMTVLINKELNTPKISEDRRYTLLFNLAEDLRQFRFHEQAIKYYQDAIATGSKSNKFNAYLGLINISIQKERPENTIELISSAKNYLTKNAKFNTKESREFLNGIAYGYQESNSDMPKGFLNTFAVDERIKTFIFSKKYDKALALFEPQVIKLSKDQNDLITYDLLNMKLNPQSLETLYCQKSYDLNPDAYTYPTILCGLLINKRAGLILENNLKRATLYFTEDNTSAKYLFDLFKEIK